EPHLQALSYRLNAPILGEGEPATLSSLFETYPELEQQFVTITLEEPDLGRASRIVGKWAAHYGRETGQQLPSDALDEALHLSHRFLARSRLPRKALDLLVQVAGFTGTRRQIDRTDVIERFSTVHHVPRVLVDPAEPLDVVSLEKSLAQELLGQPEAV